MTGDEAGLPSDKVTLLVEGTEVERFGRTERGA